MAEEEVTKYPQFTPQLLNAYRKYGGPLFPSNGFGCSTACQNAFGTYRISQVDQFKSELDRFLATIPDERLITGIIRNTEK